MGELQDLIGELKLLRRQGLVHLRDPQLPCLAAALRAADLTSEPDLLAGSLVRLLTEVVAGLDAQVAKAAALTFGLAEGTLHWPPAARRKAAAQVYGVDADAFRRRQEIDLLHHVAERILAGRTTTAAAGAPTPPVPPVPPSGSTRRFAVATPRGTVAITLHRAPVEALRDIDVLVSSENTYLEMAKTFRTSLSGSLRNAAVVRDQVGGLVDDVLQRELRAWLQANGRAGLSVAAGVVVPTSPGELQRHGVRRIYHAAAVVPRPDGHSYEVPPAAVARAVHAVFALARQERASGHALRSLCFPLFGAGRGGLDPRISFGLIWPALVAETAGRDDWDLHIVTRSEAGTAAVVQGLTGS